MHPQPAPRMGVIGLIGGLSWESSAVYYRLINEAVRERRGGASSARCLMWSFDFGEIEALQHQGRWPETEALMIDAARRLEAGGADCLLICSNTMHRMAGAVDAATRVPLLHIVDAAAAEILDLGARKVGLLGTKFTMEGAFYADRLRDRFGLETLTPGPEDRQRIHDIIYGELVGGRALPSSRAECAGIIARLVEQGADAVLLGCTELMLLIRPEDSPRPLVDTTAAHALAAVRFALD